MWYGLTGLMASAWYPAYRAYLSNAVQEKERARVFGDLNALRGLMAFPAPLIGGILYENYGFQAPILATFVLLIPVLLILFTLKEM